MFPLLVFSITAMIIVSLFCGRDMFVMAKQGTRSFIDCCAWLKAIDDFIWRP